MILLVLIALAARVDAAPSDASIALAVRYANLLSGVDDADDADEPDEPDELDEPDEPDELDDIDVASNAEIGDPEPTGLDAARGDPAGGEDPAGGGDPAEGDAGQLAMLDAEQAPAGAPTSDDASVAASPAGAVEDYEAWLRHPRLSRWGRLDVGLAWRRVWSEPMHGPSHGSEEVWLVATWRR